MRRLPQLMFAVCALAALLSCSTQKAKTPGPPIAAVNSSVAPTPEVRVESLESVLAGRPENNKELERAWANFKRSQKYRLAQLGETKTGPYQIWWGTEAYEGKEFLVAIVVDPSRTDPNRYGLVVIAAPKSDGGKYKAYWVAQEQDLSNCEISPASGSVFFNCIRADGTKDGRSLAWFRSRRQFELKNIY
jgi:hypothetical protein